MVNPDGVMNQVGRQRHPGCQPRHVRRGQFDTSGAVTSLDWATYPILRFPDLPELDVVLINRPEMQPSAPVKAQQFRPPPIANAIYDAVGLRFREGPFTPKRVLAAMQKRRELIHGAGDSTPCKHRRSRFAATSVLVNFPPLTTTPASEHESSRGPVQRSNLGHATRGRLGGWAPNSCRKRPSPPNYPNGLDRYSHD